MKEKMLRLGIQGILSFGLLGSSLYILINPELNQSRELFAFAIASISGVVAYWLK